MKRRALALTGRNGEPVSDTHTAPYRVIRDGRLIAAKGHRISAALADELGMRAERTPAESGSEPRRGDGPPPEYGGKGGIAKSSPDALPQVRGGEIDPSPYHVGGPWYEIEGERYKGKAAAIEALETANDHPGN